MRGPARGYLAATPRGGYDITILAVSPARVMLTASTALEGGAYFGTRNRTWVTPRPCTTRAISSASCAVVALEPVWGRRDLIRALERATRFRRFTATDVRAILLAGAGRLDEAQPPPGDRNARLQVV